jgi:hypothetical protein
MVWNLTISNPSLKAVSSNASSGSTVYSMRAMIGVF